MNCDNYTRPVTISSDGTKRDVKWNVSASDFPAEIYTNDSQPQQVYFIHPLTSDVECHVMTHSSNCQINSDQNASLKEIPQAWQTHDLLFQNPCVPYESGGGDKSCQNSTDNSVKMNIFNGLYCENGFSNNVGTECNL